MISTYSAWYYGIVVTGDNNILSFSEDGGLEEFAFLRTGSYTITDFAFEIARAMNEVAEENEYSVLVDRSQRLLTIQAVNASPLNFDLKVASLTSGNPVFETAGFVGSDRTGGTSYQGTLPVGSSYTTQFKLQDFIDFQDNQKAQESKVLQSATGEVEVVKFGNVQIMECNLLFITDIQQDVGSYIRSNPNGVNDARDFLLYAITKGPMEFIPDIVDPDTYTKCILEFTPESQDGTGFKLKEEYTRGLVGYFTTGRLGFRKAE